MKRKIILTIAIFFPWMFLGAQNYCEWQRDTTFYPNGDYCVTLKSENIQYRRFFYVGKKISSYFFDIKMDSDEWWVYRRKKDKNKWKMDLQEERMIDKNLLGDSMYVHYDLHYFNAITPRSLYTLSIDYGDTVGSRYQSNDKTMAYFRWNKKNNEWNSYKKIVNEKVCTETDTCYTITIYKKHKKEWKPCYKREQRNVIVQGNQKVNRKIYKWDKEWIPKYECFYGYGYGNPGLYFQKWNKSGTKYKVMKRYSYKRFYKYAHYKHPDKKYYNLLMNTIY